MEDRVLSYVDDLAIFSKTWEEHKIHHQEVLDIIKKDGLTLRGDKCLIGADSCEFLAYKVGKCRIEPVREKVTAILDFPQPKTKKDVRAWLGLTGYYRRLIPKYAARTILTSDLLKKDQPDLICWSTELQHEFDDLKSALTNEPILAAPEFSRTFILATDASARAIGGVLSQPQPNGSVLPIAYYSKKLNETQARYTATEKETYAAMKGIQHYSIYLMGQHFILETDHKPLLQLRQMNNSNQKLM